MLMNAPHAFIFKADNNLEMRSLTSFATKISAIVQAHQLCFKWLLRGEKNSLCHYLNTVAIMYMYFSVVQRIVSQGN